MSRAEEALPGLETPRRAPEAIVTEAAKRHAPVIVRFCLLSGGNDSTVLAHRMRGQYDALLHVDTGTALPGVREHVERLARDLRQPLVVYEAGDAYRRMILGDPDHRLKSERIAWGFPGPGFHNLPYRMLKDRQFEAAVRAEKQKRNLVRRRANVMLLAGVRTDESARRTGHATEVHKRGAQLWVNPIMDWTNEEMTAYREEHKLPQSDVAALIHRSGECNCGAFRSHGEREMLESLWPKWFAKTIATLEEEAAELQVPCRWGERPAEWCRPGDDQAGPACAGCVQMRLEVPS